MPKGAGKIISRLIASISVLSALLLFGPPASAHGQPADLSVARHVVVRSMNTFLTAGVPAGSRECRGGICCCILSQCSGVTIAFHAEFGTGYRPRPVTTAYVGMIVPVTVGQCAGPATPPPRLDV